MLRTGLFDRWLSSRNPPVRDEFPPRPLSRRQELEMAVTRSPLQHERRERLRERKFTIGKCTRIEQLLTLWHLELGRYCSEQVSAAAIRDFRLSSGAAPCCQAVPSLARHRTRPGFWRT